jgi:hypothetical protein
LWNYHYDSMVILTTGSINGTILHLSLIFVSSIGRSSLISSPSNSSGWSGPGWAPSPM